MEKKITRLFYFILFASVISCTYHNEEELYPAETCDTTNVTYNATILPIVTQNCYECHSGSSPVSGILLEGHSNLKAMIDAERLLGAIKHQTGFSPMPKDRPSLADCDILKIEKWVLDGALNN